MAEYLTCSSRGINDNIASIKDDLPDVGQPPNAEKIFPVPLEFFVNLERKDAVHNLSSECRIRRVHGSTQLAQFVDGPSLAKSGQPLQGFRRAASRRGFACAGQPLQGDQRGVLLRRRVV